MGEGGRRLPYIFDVIGVFVLSPFCVRHAYVRDPAESLFSTWRRPVLVSDHGGCASAGQKCNGAAENNESVMQA